MESKKAKNRTLARYIAIGLLLGLSLGAGMKNIPAGIGIGLALGAMFYQLSRNKSDKGKDDGAGKNKSINQWLKIAITTLLYYLSMHYNI